MKKYLFAVTTICVLAAATQSASAHASFNLSLGLPLYQPAPVAYYPPPPPVAYYPPPPAYYGYAPAPVYYPPPYAYGYRARYGYGYGYWR